MDPLAHTLVGACLARTRLGAATPLAVPALLLGVNAPDLDAIAMWIDGDLALGVRRGWTHGVLAMLVLPALLVGLLLAFERMGRRFSRRAAAPDPLRLWLLCQLAVWTHPLLDWLNTYGIRLLMPFDGRWFYGDTLFIVDPWLWLMTAAPVLLGSARTARSLGLWLGLAVATTWLVVTSPLVPVTARGVWVACVCALAGLRAAGAGRKRVSSVALVALAISCVYVAAMYAGSQQAERRADAWLRARGVRALDIMAGPVPADPFERHVVAATQDRYHLLTVDLQRGEVRERAPALPIGDRGPIVDAARTAPHVQGLVTWLRFPSYAVEATPRGHRVTILDARRVGRGGIGLAVVELDHALRVIPPP